MIDVDEYISRLRIRYAKDPAALDILFLVEMVARRQEADRFELLSAMLLLEDDCSPKRN